MRTQLITPALVALAYTAAALPNPDEATNSVPFAWHDVEAGAYAAAASNANKPDRRWIDGDEAMKVRRGLVFPNGDKTDTLEARATTTKSVDICGLPRDKRVSWCGFHPCDRCCGNTYAPSCSQKRAEAERGIAEEQGSFPPAPVAPTEEQYDRYCAASHCAPGCLSASDETCSGGVEKRGKKSGAKSGDRATGLWGNPSKAKPNKNVESAVPVGGDEGGDHEDDSSWGKRAAPAGPVAGGVSKPGVPHATNKVPAYGGHHHDRREDENLAMELYCAEVPEDPDCNKLGKRAGACEAPGSGCIGDVTHYDGGLGACGWNVNTATDFQIALPYGLMGTLSNSNPYCGRQVTVKNPTTGATANAKVGDKCMGCQGYSIDLTDALFNTIAACDGRCGGFEWWFSDQGAVAAGGAAGGAATGVATGVAAYGGAATGVAAAIQADPNATVY